MSNTIDGFNFRETEAFASFRHEVMQRASEALNALAQRLHIEIEGIENLPSGRALVVANHTFGYDATFAVTAVYQKTGRVLWSLGEHTWWRVPFLRRFMVRVGMVDGTQENTDRLLQGDQWVLVLPGGLRESVKPHELRYRLLWGHRYGFVRLAIRNQAPIVPLAMVGADDLFNLVGNAMQRGRRIGFPIPKPAHGLPVFHPVQLKGIFGEPIVLQAKPEQCDDPEVLRRCRREVEGALYELIDAELARRAGFEVDSIADVKR